MHRTVDNCLHDKKGERMKGIQTVYTKPRGTMVNRNGWESILGRLDTVTDEINRRLGWTAGVEEPRSGLKIVLPPKK